MIYLVVVSFGHLHSNQRAKLTADTTFTTQNRRTVIWQVANLRNHTVPMSILL